METSNGENMCMEVVNSDLQYLNLLESGPGVRFVSFRKPFEI